MNPLDISIAIAIIVSVSGGVFAALLGWAESTEAFNPRKMFVGLARGGLGGIITSGVVIFLNAPEIIGLAEYVLLFIAAVGIDLAAAKGSHIVKTVNTPRTD